MTVPFLTFNWETKMRLLALAAKWRAEGEYWTGSPGDAARQDCADDLLLLLRMDPKSFAMGSDSQKELLNGFGIPDHPSDSVREYIASNNSHLSRLSQWLLRIGGRNAHHQG